MTCTQSSETITEYSTRLRVSGPKNQVINTAKTYQTRDSLKSLLALANNYLTCFICIATVELGPKTRLLPANSSGGLYLLATVIIASRMRALENLVHEASHNNLFKKISWHHRLQFMYAFPIFRLLEDYRRSHLVHHQRLGDRHRDPDMIRFRHLGLHRVSENPVWYLCGLPMTGFFTFEYLTTTFCEFWQSSTSRFAKSVFWLLIMATIWKTASLRHFVSYYIVPFLIVLPVVRFWAEASEHLGLDLRNQFGSSRTNIGSLHAWLLNPHNDGFHAVHHLHSQIPFHALPDAHQHLMASNDEFAKKTVISRGLIETFRQMAMNETIFKE